MGLWRSREIKPDDRRLPSATNIGREIDDTGVDCEVMDEDLTKLSPKLGAIFSLDFIRIKMIFTNKKMIVAILFNTSIPWRFIQCLTVFVFLTRSLNKVWMKTGFANLCEFNDFSSFGC